MGQYARHGPWPQSGAHTAVNPKLPYDLTKDLAANNDALKSPDVAKRFTADGSTPAGSTLQQFSAHIRSESAKWKKLVTEANLQLGS